MTCLSEIMDRGVAKMQELQLEQTESSVFDFFEAGEMEGKPRGCCALGILLLGIGITPDSQVQTGDALDWIAEACESIMADTEFIDDDNGGRLTVGNVIWRMNDGCDVVEEPQPVSTILDWLKEHGY